MYGYRTSTKRWNIEIISDRDDKDYTALDKKQVSAILYLIQKEIDRIDEKVGARIRPQLVARREFLVDLICCIDI